MSSSLVALAYEAGDPVRLAGFWAGVLDRAIVQDSRGALLPGSGTQVGLRFVAGAGPTSYPSRIHLHLTSSSLADQQHTIAAALELGAAHLDVGQLPEEEHVVLADPEGNEFCVIEPGNKFLAGCGFLGELTCDGTRAVGSFWSEALGWPLVWDENEQTAIQSPHGGTKLSWDSWGDPAVAPRNRRNRQRFEVAVLGGDLEAETERLVALGALPLGDGSDNAIELADPDGNEFCLTA